MLLRCSGGTAASSLLIHADGIGAGDGRALGVRDPDRDGFVRFDPGVADHRHREGGFGAAGREHQMPALRLVVPVGQGRAAVGGGEVGADLAPRWPPRGGP